MTASIWEPIGGLVSVVTIPADVASQEFTATAAQTIFDLTLLTYLPNTTSLQVFKNGSLLSPTAYAETYPTQFVLVSPATAGDKIIAYALTGGVSAGVEWKGAYSAGILYTSGDAVGYLGSAYICKLQSLGNAPTVVTYWDIMAEKGAAGTSGAGTGDMLAANSLSELTATATTSRTNISAAKSGANSDITSLTGLTTALSIAQGGTGATSAAAAVEALGLEGYRNIGTTPFDIWYGDGIGGSGFSACAANQLILVPWMCRKSGTLDAIAVAVAAGVTGAVGTLGIYSVTSKSNIYPNALLTACTEASLSYASPTVVQSALSLPVVAGTMYYLALSIGTAVPTLRTITGGISTSPELGTSATIGLFGTGALRQIYAARTHTAALPATFPAGGVLDTAYFPVILVHYGV